MENSAASVPVSFTTSSLATATGYSVQQVRDLERLGVIPSTFRQPNGYRQFGMTKP